MLEGWTRPSTLGQRGLANPGVRRYTLQFLLIVTVALLTFAFSRPPPPTRRVRAPRSTLPRSARVHLPGEVRSGLFPRAGRRSVRQHQDRGVGLTGQGDRPARRHLREVRPVVGICEQVVCETASRQLDAFQPLGGECGGQRALGVDPAERAVCARAGDGDARAPVRGAANTPTIAYRAAGFRNFT